MNTVVNQIEVWPKRLHSKIVGTTFEGRQSLLAECKRQGVSSLRLVRDPNNSFDPHAIAVEADLVREDGSAASVRLGFISNGEHFCSDCGAIVGNALFHNSKTIRCGECGMVFKLGDSSNSHTACPNPTCRSAVEVASSKIVICPRCGGVDFGRGGLATRISRAMAAGVEYRASVTEYTGGESYAGSQQRSMGCNILIERIESNDRSRGGDNSGTGT